MGINPIQMMQLLRGGNPRKAAMDLLQSEVSNGNNNAVLTSIMQMAQSGDMKGIEQVARNIVSEQGLDFDTEFNKFKQQYNLK